MKQSSLLLLSQSNLNTELSAFQSLFNNVPYLMKLSNAIPSTSQATFNLTNVNSISIIATYTGIDLSYLPIDIVTVNNIIYLAEIASNNTFQMFPGSTINFTLETIFSLTPQVILGQQVPLNILVNNSNYLELQAIGRY